jgi:hypothetical protein
MDKICYSCKQTIIPGRCVVYLFAGSGSITQNIHEKKSEFGDFFRSGFLLCSSCAKDCANHKDRLITALKTNGITNAKFYWNETLFPYYQKLLKDKSFSRICGLVRDKLTDTTVQNDDAILTINWKGRFLGGGLVMVMIDDVIDAIGSFKKGFKYQMHIKPGIHYFRTPLAFKSTPTIIQVESGKNYFIDLKRNSTWGYFEFICNEVK